MPLHRIALADRTLRRAPSPGATGRGFTLGELADLAKRHCTKDLEVQPATPRSYDVSRFFGTPASAQQILGWSHLIPIEEGFASMVRAFEGAAAID